MLTLKPTRCLGVCAALVFLFSPLAVSAAPDDNCRMQISNTLIDYGQITRAELLERQVTPTALALGKQNMTLSATCRQPTLMTVFFRGAAGDGNSYRFGNAGNFTLRFSSAQIDGKPVRLGTVNIAGQQPENMGETAVLAPNMGVVAVVDERAVKGTSFSVTVEVDTKVTGTASRVKDKTVWRSSGSFEIVEN